jgi:hypothetical protein
VGDSHESRHFFVADLNKFDLVGSLKRPDHTVDAITGITVDAPNAPSMQPLDDEITDFHLTTPDWREAMRRARSGLAV